MPAVRRGRVTRTLAARTVAVLVLATTMLCAEHAAAQDLQLIELHHRLADEVIPALLPLLEPGGAITGAEAMLFVRTSPANLEQIRQAVATLDRRPRQLRITVGQGTVEAGSAASVRGAATIGEGDLQVGVNRPSGTAPGVAAQAQAITQRTDLHNLSSVAVLEGTETYVAVGQSAPVSTARVTTGQTGPAVVHATEYRAVGTGFYATARVNGDLVTLELASQQRRFSGAGAERRIDGAGTSTRVSGRLGEWLPVAGSSDAARTATRGVLEYGSSTAAAAYAVWVKVEEVP